MNKNKKLRNFLLLKASPAIGAIVGSIGLAYLVNEIPFINKMDKSNTIAIFVGLAVVFGLVLFTLILFGIKKLDLSRANKAMTAKIMLGENIIKNTNIKSREDAIKYVASKKQELARVQAETNSAIRTLEHFGKNAKHIDEVKSV